MKKFILAAIVALMCVAAVFGIVACDDTNLPTEKLVGYDIDLARAVGEYLGVDVEFQKIDWDNKEFELASKNIDLLWNGMTIDDERNAAWEIRDPYMLNKQLAIIRKSDASKYDTLEKMKSTNKWIAEKGSAGKKIIDTFVSNAIGAAAQIDILTELKSGTADIGVMDQVMAGYYIEQSGSSYSSDLMIAPVNVTEEDEYYGIACRKGEVALMDKINTALVALQASGKINEIATNYGVKNAILPIQYTSPEGITDGSWDYITGKGKIVIGYTLFAPIAFKVIE